jgi:hypothetical protein
LRKSLRISCFRCFPNRKRAEHASEQGTMPAEPVALRNGHPCFPVFREEKRLTISSILEGKFPSHSFLNQKVLYSSQGGSPMYVDLCVCQTLTVETFWFELLHHQEHVLPRSLWLEFVHVLCFCCTSLSLSLSRCGRC